MAASFLHGIEITEIKTGPVPVTVVNSAVIGLVGTAPQWAAASSAPTPPAANTPTLVNSASSASQFGPLVRGYTIPYALNAILAQGSGQIIVVNVFNPATHQTVVAATTMAMPATGTQVINLKQMGIVGPGLPNSGSLATTVTVAPATAPASWTASTPYTVGTLIKPTTGNVGNFIFKCTVAGTSGVSEPGTWNQTVGGVTDDGATLVWTNVGVNGYIENTDYTVDYVNGFVYAKSGGSIASAESLSIGYAFADPSKVEDSDIIGAVSGGTYTGMQAFLTTFQSMGIFPKLLIAPGWSSDETTAAALTTLAGTVRGMAFIDAAANTPVATAISNRGTTGQAFDTSSYRAVLCFPQEEFYDTGIVPTGNTLSNQGAVINALYNANADSPYSQWVAGATAAQDIANGYWFSPSNTQVTGIVGPDVTMYASAFDPASDTNNLNAAGILTVFNGFGTGLRVWGNTSAAYPTYTDAATFIPVRRTMDVVEASVQLAMLQFLDQPITNGLINSILASVNGFLRTLIQRGALIGGVCSYNPAENSAVQLAAGQLTFDISLMPPPPAQTIDFNVFVNTALLNTLGPVSASQAAA